MRSMARIDTRARPDAAAKAKALRRGVKEVVKAVRKGEKGFVLIAGDISPIDVIAHLPILCEDKVSTRDCLCCINCLCCISFFP